MPKVILCYFCGKEGKQSVEHFFSRWSRKLLPIRTDVKAGYYRDNIHTKTLPGSVGTEVTKNVCQRCNNGWMSGIQTSARATLEPWLTGQRPVISTANSRQITQWALMTHLSIDSYDKDFSYMPITERRRFCETGEPTNDWHVFAGTVAGDLDRGWRHIGLSYPVASYHTVILSGVSVILATFLPQESKETFYMPNGLFSIWPKVDPAINVSAERMQLELVRYLPELTMGRNMISPIIDPINGLVR